MSSPSSRTTSTFSQTTSLTSISTLETSPFFPPEFGFYRSSPNTTLLALTSKDPSPFAHIQSYHGFRNKPDLTLYQGRQNWYRQLASAQFVGQEGKPHITLGSTRYGAAPTEKVECEGLFQVVNHFSLYLEDAGVRERFEWRNCRRGELRVYGVGHSFGMKLVRVMTGEVVAVYAKVSCAVRKIGKIRFMGREMGNDLQVMAVMSLLAILEAERRNCDQRDGEEDVVLWSPVNKH